MNKKHRVLLIILSVIVVFLIALTDFVDVYPMGSGIWNDAKSFFNNLGLKKAPDNEIDALSDSPEKNSAFLRDNIPAESYESLIEYEEAVISAVDKSALSVVSIVVSKDVPILDSCPITDPFFGPDFHFYVPCDSGRTKTVEVGGGTGFFVTSDGLILTNGHVVSDKNAEYTVFLGDGSRYNAWVVAVDEDEDLAILEVEGVGFPVLTLGNSDSVRLGQTAIAIGNALGEYKDTVSVGVISGLSRTITAKNQSGDIETIEEVFQTDAAINPGNSGGPLINLRGEVIGINTAIAYGAENIGFAIPINKARGVMESLIASLSDN